MTVNTFTQPDMSSQGGSVYKGNIEGAIAALAEIAGAFACHQQSTADMTVAIDAGRIYNVDTEVLTSVAATSTGTITAPASNPRKDIVYIDETSGAVGVATGTEAASPSDPTIPAGKIPVARISLTTSTTEITNADLEDLRTAYLTGWLKPDGDGSALTNVTTIDQASRDNIMLLAWDQLELAGASYAGLSNMVVDAYEDETGVDTATSSNETYDATNDLYHNPGDVTTPSASGEYNGATASATFSGDDVELAIDKAIRVGDSFTGDFEYNFKWSHATASARVGLYDVTDDATFNQNSNTGAILSNGGSSAISGSFTLHASSSTNCVCYSVNTNDGNFTVADQDEITISRSGTTITVKKNGTPQVTFSVSSSAELRLIYATGNTGFDIDDVSWTVPGTPADMALVSKASTAASDPSELRIGCEFDNQDNPTLGTDLILEGSIDNGSTWEEVASYSEFVKSGNINMVFGTADVSGQTGTSVRTRIRALNGEYVPIRKSGVQADVALTPPA